MDGFDRQMDSRTLTLQDPETDGDTLRVNWQVEYTKAGCPNLVISGVEIATFDGNRISRLKDEFDPEAETNMMTWMGDHGAKLAG